MSGLVTASAGALATDAVSAPAGRTQIHGRVIEKVVWEASANVIGVTRSDVAVDVSERGSSISVRVATKLPIPRLDDTDAVRGDGSLLERVRAAQGAMAAEFARLTGREVHRVSVIVTGAVVPSRRRVR